MNVQIPLHSLVYLVGDGVYERDYIAEHWFDDYELISLTKVQYDLVGHRPRSNIDAKVFDELRRRVALRLEMGERVVVNSPEMRGEERRALRDLAARMGVPFVFLACCEDFSTEIVGEAPIIHVSDEPDVAKKVDHTARSIASKYDGITVVGDVHGMLSRVKSAVAWAQSRQHYIIFLGDVVDYGHETLEVADYVHDVVMGGAADFIIGNHERKIARWLNQPRAHLRLSAGNRVTTDRLNALDPAQRYGWTSRFNGLLAHSRSIYQIGNMVVAHAGVHPGFWDNSASAHDIENWALVGEYGPVGYGNSRPQALYSWANSVPKGAIAIVGHNVRSTRCPVSQVNDRGGTSIYLDTGSGKGGPLSSVDLRYGHDGSFKVENFNLY